MNKFENIDKYITSFPSSIQKVLVKIRTIAKDIAPNSIESISYGMPTLKLNGKNLFHFAAYKSHIGIYPATGSFPTEDLELNKYRTGRGTFQFPLDKPIQYDLIKKIIKLRFIFCSLS